QLLLRPRVTSGTRMLSLNTDRVDIPGQTRIGARARMPSLASGNHIPGTVPTQTQIGQRAFKVRTTVLHNVQRRVITGRTSRSSSMMPNNAPRLVHSPVASGLPPRNLNNLKTSLPKNTGQISQVHSYPLSKLGYKRDAQRDDTGGRQSHTGDPPLPLLKNTNEIGRASCRGRGH